MNIKKTVIPFFTVILFYPALVLSSCFPKKGQHERVDSTLAAYQKEKEKFERPPHVKQESVVEKYLSLQELILEKDSTQSEELKKFFEDDTNSEPNAKKEKK